MEYDDLLLVVWLLLPAGVANMAPVVAAKLSIFSALEGPVDGGRGILGDHKTWRGFLVGPLAGSLAAIVLHFIWPVGPLAEVGTSAFFGGAMGFLALVGDALGSLLKRRLNIPIGKSLPVIDQLDWVVTSLLLLIIFTPVSTTSFLFAGLIFTAVSFLISFVGVQLKIKQRL